MEGLCFSLFPSKSEIMCALSALRSISDFMLRYLPSSFFVLVTDSPREGRSGISTLCFGDEFGIRSQSAA